MDKITAGLDSLQTAQPSAGRGDAGDVATWVAQHWDSVYKLLYRLTISAHEAEELTQETFFRGIERRGSFKPGTNLRAWLLRIATNAFLDDRRHQKVMKIAPFPDEIVEDVPQPGQGLEDQEFIVGVEAAIAQLPPTARLVFLLRSQQDLSFREIGETIGTTEETARWHMMQARKQLLATLNGNL